MHRNGDNNKITGQKRIRSDDNLNGGEESKAPNLRDPPEGETPAFSQQLARDQVQRVFPLQQTQLPQNSFQNQLQQLQGLLQQHHQQQHHHHHHQQQQNSGMYQRHVLVCFVLWPATSNQYLCNVTSTVLSHVPTAL